MLKPPSCELLTLCTGEETFFSLQTHFLLHPCKFSLPLLSFLSGSMYFTPLIPAYFRAIGLLNSFCLGPASRFRAVRLLEFRSCL